MNPSSNVKRKDDESSGEKRNKYEEDFDGMEVDVKNKVYKKKT
jgi:hypothetical protein